MRISIYISAFFFICGSLSAMAAPTSEVVDAHPPVTIRFATEATYPPFEFVDENGTLKGFDIDLAKALCSQMHAECTFSSAGFNGLITSLNLNKYDAIIAAMSVTPARAKEVSFTESYYEPTASFVAPVSQHITLASLSGKTIGVQTGTTFENYLHHTYANKVSVKTYNSIQDAFLDLVSGRIDAVLTDTPIANTWIKKNSVGTFAIVDHPIVDHTYFGSGFAIAVRPQDKKLLDALNAALKVIHDDGTYQNLYQQYFGT